MRIVLCSAAILAVLFATAASASEVKPFQNRLGDPIVQSKKPGPLWPGFTRERKRGKLKVVKPRKQ